MRERAAEYGLEILSNDWTKYDANHVVTRTKGASPSVIQSVADEYEDTMERYLKYQDHLFARDELPPYERKMYLRRLRQQLLWKLLLDDVVEGLPAYREDAVGSLVAAVAEAANVKPEFAASEMTRVLELGALVPEADARRHALRLVGVSDGEPARANRPALARAAAHRHGIPVRVSRSPEAASACSAASAVMPARPRRSSRCSGSAVVIELIGGALVALGVRTSIAAFVCSGQMAVAYFMFHQPKAPLPIQNGGELAALYAFVFLFIAAKGRRPTRARTKYVALTRVCV